VPKLKGKKTYSDDEIVVLMAIFAQSDFSAGDDVKDECKRIAGNNFFQLTSFTTKRGYLARGSRTGRITCKPPLASLRKLLRPFIINTLGNTFTPTKFSDGLFTAQSVQHNADLFFG
jgi:hypothetical protein